MHLYFFDNILECSYYCGSRVEFFSFFLANTFKVAENGDAQCLGRDWVKVFSPSGYASRSYSGMKNDGRPETHPTQPDPLGKYCKSPLNETHFTDGKLTDYQASPSDSVCVYWTIAQK